MERKIVKSKKIKILTCPTAVRIRRKIDGEIVQDCDLYVGRRCTMSNWNLSESIWANPYKVDKKGKKNDGNIDQVLEKYEKHVRSRPDLLKQIYKLSGKRLGCFCKNKGFEKCHIDVLIKLWEEQFDILVRMNKRE